MIMLVSHDSVMLTKNYHKDKKINRFYWPGCNGTSIIAGRDYLNTIKTTVVIEGKNHANMTTNSNKSPHSGEILPFLFIISSLLEIYMTRDRW